MTPKETALYTIIATWALLLIGFVIYWYVSIAIGYGVMFGTAIGASTETVNLLSKWRSSRKVTVQVSA